MKRILDFTSALYLGFNHPSEALQPWAQLTTGRPAALRETRHAREIAKELARLQGGEGGILGPSTLHLFWDLFGVLAHDRIVIYLETGTYPIGKWGVERCAARGVPVLPFRQHDPEDLKRQIQKRTGHRCRPVVVTDGMHPGRWGPTPLGKYLEVARRYGGYLVIDDTQALGVLGRNWGPTRPYGFGGGGSLQWHKVGGPDVVVISSLAKGFGVPMAVLVGSKQFVNRFEAASETRVHCSPPSMASLAAAQRALAINQSKGNTIRYHLADLVKRFSTQLAAAG